MALYQLMKCSRLVAHKQRVPLTTLNDAKIFINTNWLRRVQGEVTQPSTVIANIQSAVSAKGFQVA